MKHAAHLPPSPKSPYVCHSPIQSQRRASPAASQELFEFRSLRDYSARSREGWDRQRRVWDFPDSPINFPTLSRAKRMPMSRLRLKMASETRRVAAMIPLLYESWSCKMHSMSLASPSRHPLCSFDVSLAHDDKQSLRYFAAHWLETFVSTFQASMALLTMTRSIHLSMENRDLDYCSWYY